MIDFNKENRNMNTKLTEPELVYLKKKTDDFTSILETKNRWIPLVLGNKMAN